MYKMRTSRKRPSRESAFSIAESFSLGKPHNSQIQLQGMPCPGRSNVSWAATLEVWLPHGVRRGLCFCCRFPFLPLPHRRLSLLGGRILNIVGQIFSFFAWLDSAMFLREETPVTLCWDPGKVLDPVGYWMPGVVKVHPQRILPASPFEKWCLLVDFWLSDPLKVCTCGGQWSHCYPGCRWVSGWIAEPMVVYLAASIWVNTGTGHKPVTSVLFYWQLSPITTSFPHCNAQACLKACQKPPLGSQQSERMRPYCYTAGDCLGAWMGAVLCHLPTEPQKRSQPRLVS